MQTLVVVNQPSDWRLEIPGVEVVPAKAYLTDPSYSKLRGVKIFNLCRSYRYQSSGYYVSLLAAARGHKPLPTVTTIQDMKSQTIIRVVSDDLDEIIQKSLAPLPPEKINMHIYFGRNMDERFDRLGVYLFKLFEAPLLRASFNYDPNSKWQLQNVSPISANEIPDDHRDFVVKSVQDYFKGRRLTVPKRAASRYDLAILYNSPDTERASNEKAIQKFIKAAEGVGFDTEIIHKEDFGRLAEFDALFIRETTNVNHHTYRFARRAVAEGLVVIDDPESILKCANKVYLAEMLERYKIRTPKTMIVHRDNVNTIAAEMGFPCILKQPDSSFSLGVTKVNTEAELKAQVEPLLDKSDLVIAQEFRPTEFDWRIGILDKKPLYACKYFMVRKHWQILKSDASGKTASGKVQTLPVEVAPRQVVRTALAAANLIGDGFYGVDLKQIGKDCLVIEVNDNPSVDVGDEDAILKDELYARVMDVFLRRVERLKNQG